MAYRGRTKRVGSYEVLASISPGEGDSWNLFDTDPVGDEKSDRPRRRRRKPRMRRSSAGDLSPVSPTVEGFDGTGRDYLSRDSGSVDTFGGNAFVFTADFPVGRSTSISSPSISGESANDPSFSLRASPRRTRSLEALQECGSGPLIEMDHGCSSQLDSGQVSTLGSITETAERDVRRRESGGAIAVLKENVDFSHSTVEPIAQQDLTRSPLRSLSYMENLPPGVPDFSSANGAIMEPGFVPGGLYPPADLRQRILEKHSKQNGLNPYDSSVGTECEPERNLKPACDASPSLQRTSLGQIDAARLEDWERLMSPEKNTTHLEFSPLQYIRDEIYGDSSLRNSNAAGSDHRREQVYNTMFHVPWRCELLIDVGLFVCVDAFLSLLTLMPARIAIYLWDRIVRFRKCRQSSRPHAAELCDLGSLIVLIVGVSILNQVDISIVYHWIRCQGVVKLYVIFNVLEIFDRLCQSFGADVLQVLFNSAESVANSGEDSLSTEVTRFALDQCIAIICFLVHALVIITQAVTLSAAVNAQNNALLTLLISNNFAEIKSNVFKRMGTDQLHKMAYSDTVERFHILTHVLFVWAQNVENGEESLWLKFFYNAGMVFVCEMLVDIIKHAFLAKFNDVKPALYSQFLQNLCTQTLNSRSHEVHKTMCFVPLAPACVVIRILYPVYISFIPEGPFWWRWPAMLTLSAITYAFLCVSKVFIGLGLQTHARWYLKRHPLKFPHAHEE